MSFSRPIDHQEYIRLKYLDEDDGEVKKKKLRKKVRVKAAIKKSNFRIIDDDLDLKKIQSNVDEDDDEILMKYGTNEERPSVAMIIDERSSEFKRKDKVNLWKPIAPPTDESVKPSSSVSPKPSTSSTYKITKSQSNTSSMKNKVLVKIEEDEEGDISPPRIRKRNESEDDISPLRARRKSYSDDDDLSPPRIKREGTSTDPSADMSPPRIRKRNDSDDDMSPPRAVRRRYESDEDLSPPRPKRTDRSDESHSKNRRRDDNLDKRNKLGLTEDEMGKNAKTVYRDRSTGQKRDMEAEAKTKVKPDPEDEELKKKYEKWSKGVKQVQAIDERIEEVLKEMDKPLARHEDDEDRDKYLRERELKDDPMLQYIRKKKQKEELKKSAQEGKVVSVMPKYKGPPAPPNRYGIEPGYRWDGVDRSNGFEKKLLSKNAEKSANLDEAYKWSTEDM